MFTVVVGDHAREQARARFEGFKAARIVDEVRAALRDGRCGTEPPGGMRQSVTERTRSLYAWTEDGVRVYALRALENCFFVQTTLRRDEK